MIIYLDFIERSLGGLKVVRVQGWYLFWFIPLYVRRITLD